MLKLDDVPCHGNQVPSEVRFAVNHLTMDQQTLQSEIEKQAKRDTNIVTFETAYEKWLKKHELEMEQGERPKEQPQDGGGGALDEEDGVEEEMPVIQREVWREEDIEGMPVLQKMVDLPSPPPLQITLSISDSRTKDWQSKGSKNKLPDEDKNLKMTGGHGKDYDYPPQDVSLLKDKSMISRVQADEEENCSKHEKHYQPEPKDSDLKKKALHQCHGKSALTELTQLSHDSSPTVTRGLEVDSVRSPECDLPMEPDSTSEFVAKSSKWLRARKGSETSRGEVSPWREVSPRSTGCTGLRTPTCSSSDVLLRVDQSPAECDSTSMFTNSPNAISPASQGEIEERVCPVLADQEDGTSPAHYMCRCRSLPPPSDLMARDHTPVTTMSQLTVNSSATVSCHAKSKSWTTLVTHTTNLYDEPAPDLEKVAPSLDLMTPPGDVLQSDNDSPPVLTLPEQEARVKQFSIEHSQTEAIPADLNQQEAPPLIRYDPEPTQVTSGEISMCNRYSDNTLVLSSNDSQEKCNKSPPVLSLHGQDVRSKPIKTKVQTDVCDFTRNIDWETAVAETVESPPSLTKYDGEGKPGIILKIRTKGKIAPPPVQMVSKPLPTAASVSAKRRRLMTIDNSEIMSRLRKRHKSETDKNSTAMCAEGEQLQTSSTGSMASDSQNRTVEKNDCSHVGPSRPKEKTRRNAVPVLGGLKVSTQLLSVRDSKFVQSSVELSRLQTLTHELVCMLFPGLQSRLNHIAPESCSFTKVIDDIIFSLEHSPSERDIIVDCEDLSDMFKELTLKKESVPVFSPQVVLCSSPGHAVEDFRGKVCSLFQLLLPDLNVSLTNTLSHSSQELETFLKKVIMANVNRAKAAKKTVF